MTVGVLTLQDTFNRANAVLNGAAGSDGNSWAGTTNFDVVSNQAHVIASASGMIAYGATSYADAWVEAVYISGSGHGPGIRLNTATTTGIITFVTGGKVRVYEFLNGVSNNLGTGSTTLNANDRFALYGNGSSVSTYINDTLEATYTTTILTAGKPGLYGEVADALLDLFKVYVATAGGAIGGFQQSPFVEPVQAVAWRGGI